MARPPLRPDGSNQIAAQGVAEASASPFLTQPRTPDPERFQSASGPAWLGQDWRAGGQRKEAEGGPAKIFARAPGPPILTTGPQIRRRTPTRACPPPALASSAPWRFNHPALKDVTNGEAADGSGEGISEPGRAARR